MNSSVSDAPIDALTDTTPAESTPASDRPVHLARCGECGHSVTFRPSATGAGFTLVDAGTDATYGVGEHGRPLCPDGHGEMGVADDQLKSAAEAIPEVAARVAAANQEPVQRTLPGVAPPFNYAGCWKELAEQARLIGVLEEEYEADAKTARESKKRLDEAKDKLVALTVTYDDRRRAKEAPGPDPEETGARSPRLVKCTWEAQHANAVCPLCGPDRNPFLVEQYLGNPDALPPPDAEAHVDAVTQYLTARDIDDLREELEGIETFIGADVIGPWSAEERQAVLAYVEQQHLIQAATLGPGVERLERPAVLGTPHLPSLPVGDAPQRCSMCDEILPIEDGNEPFQVTDLVGTDCRRKPKKAEGPEHHYPDTSKKKPTAKGGRGKAAKAPAAAEDAAPTAPTGDNWDF